MGTESKQVTYIREYRTSSHGGFAGEGLREVRQVRIIAVSSDNVPEGAEIVAGPATDWQEDK